MYFKALEIVGFKSFCNKTNLQFEPGITAIVGPNGCGKSNIFDSIRWVLGEQSAKSMRGSAMEDVIFNGADTKEPLGMAEVSLTFDNSNKFFPVGYSEVIITRRLFRSGDSEYLLNKIQVRLKDIMDLLLGTGIGAESYSLIPQGKIDLILSSKPEDRRVVFDEASGITKYKAQKKEALRKIEETEQNLLRVNDIIVEVKRQIGSLERQANKARKYKEVFEGLKTKELILANIQKDELEQNKAVILKKIADLKLQESQLVDLANQQESGILKQQSELKYKEDIILKFKNEIMNLENIVSMDNERINLNKERIIELASTKERLAPQIQQAKNRLAIDEEKLNCLRHEYTTIRGDIEARDKALSEKESQLKGISSSIKLSSENIVSSKKSILDLEIRISNARNELSEITSKQQIYLARQKRLEIEKTKINEEISAAKANIDNINQEIAGVTAEFQSISLRISGIQANLDTEKSIVTNISAEINSLEKQNFSLQSQRQFLEELKIKYEDISESMNAVIYLDKLPAERISGLVVKIKDYINLADADKKSFEQFNLKVSGEAKPFDLDTRKISEKLAQIETRIEALKKDKEVKNSLIEEFNNTLAELEKSLRAQEINLANKKTFQQTALDEFNKVRDEEDLIRIELSDMETELAAANEKIGPIKASSMHLEEELKLKENTIVNEQNSISLNNGLREEALVDISRIKTELDALNKRLGSDDSTLKELENRYNQDKENLMNFEKQIDDTLLKQQSLGEEIRVFESRIKESTVDIASRKAALEETDSLYQEISLALNESVAKIELTKKELGAAKNNLYELQLRLKDVEFKYISLKERLLQAYKIDFEQLSGLPTVNALCGEQSLTVSNPEQNPQESLPAGPAISGANSQEAKNPEENAVIDVNALVEEIKKLKERIDSYGSVNLVAIEEYDDLKKRYDFLEQQQADLVTAKESLHDAILKINRTTKKMFIETFEKIRIEFRNYFRLLFNGGDAQIYLIDEQDPLESGIEIICRPPGKKLQNVLLLSGGEKSMSAIALIFAIFKIKPAPFCVLDEIDAALDEANVDRFGKVLQEFAKISQFIVITHNKKTISNADIMYGITMEESGVSKIVSVKFAQNKSVQTTNQINQPLAELV